MKKLFWKMVALDARIDESNAFWAVIVIAFVIGYAHFFIIWLSNH